MELDVCDNGAWCWFQDQRAVVAGEQLVFCSITDQGAVRATTHSLTTGETSHVTLHGSFDIDDHNVPGMLLRQDGHLMAFYARHGRDGFMHYRTSMQPGDGRQWGSQQTYRPTREQNITYANPFQLSAEDGRIYNFWRGWHRNPCFTFSDDLGQTWAEDRNFIYYRERQRPYVKYASNGRDTIHFAFTQAHPNDLDLPTSLYHAYYRAGQLYQSDGTAIGSLQDGPISPELAVRVYHGQDNPLGKAWVWSVALDADDNPVIAYNTCLGPDDHRYRYARFNAATGTWQDRQIACAGRCLYPREAYYSGGIVLDPDDPSTLYLSSNVNLHDGSPNASGRYELYRGRTFDGGQQWDFQSLTADSSEDFLRPVVPANHGSDTFVLCMKGDYRTYTDFQTRIVLFRQ